MRFPLECCVAIKDLTKDQYIQLINKVSKENTYNRLKGEIPEDWKYIGLTMYYDLMHYNSNVDYIGIDNEPFNNILTKDWVIKYLEEGK